MLIHEVPLHGSKVGVWCAMNITTITGSILLDYKFYVTQPDTIFQTSQTILCTAYSVFGKGIISMSLWPPGSPDLRRGGFYMWTMLKDKVYSTSTNVHGYSVLKLSDK
jgi:hypothetical protein